MPAHKNSQEIADIRGVRAGEDVISPPTHNAFNTPLEMLEFIKTLRSMDSVPFGTQIDTYKSGYEWIGHSLSALSVDDLDDDPRVVMRAGL